VAKLFRRRFRRARAAVKYSWVTTTFSFSTLDRTGAALTSQVLLDSSHWEGDTLSLNKKCVVRRVIATTAYSMILDLSVGNQFNVALAKYLMIEDDDEVDANLFLGTSLGLTQQNRILHQDLALMYGQCSDPDNPSYQSTHPTYKVDWKGKMTLQGNQRLILNHQAFNNVAGSLLNLSSSTLCRTLIEQP